MNWLARLKNISSTSDSNLQKLQKGVSVVFVGSSLGYSQKSLGDPAESVATHAEPANDPAAPSDTFSARLGLFTGRGLSVEDADDLAQRLTQRDLEQDERQVCLECRHMSGDVQRSRCSQWRKLWIGDASMPADLVATLQRCAGFSHRLEVATCTAKKTELDNHEGIDHAKD